MIKKGNKKGNEGTRKQLNNMAIVSTHVSIILWIINYLNSPIKKHRVKKRWVKNQVQTTCCLQKIFLSFKDIDRLKVKRWKKIFHAKKKIKTEHKIAIFISLKIRLYGSNGNMRLKMLLYIKILVHLEAKIVIGIYVPSIRALKFVKQILTDPGKK